jgi:hypothetical protein
MGLRSFIPGWRREKKEEFLLASFFPRLRFAYLNLLPFKPFGLAGEAREKWAFLSLLLRKLLYCMVYRNG